MNDYFIWKNNKDSEEVLAERCIVFGQDTYVKKNISKIKNIMEAMKVGFAIALIKFFILYLAPGSF